MAQNALKYATILSVENVSFQLVYHNRVDDAQMSSIIEECSSREKGNIDFWIALQKGVYRARIQRSVDNWCENHFERSDFTSSVAIAVAFFVYDGGVPPLPPP